MQNRLWRIVAGGLILMLASLACGVSAPAGGAATPDLLGTTVARTLAALTAAASSPGLGAAATPTFTASAVVSPAPSVTSTPKIPATATVVPGIATTSSGPQNSLVTTSTLCWLGPGKIYEVSSTIQKGTRVELLGRGDISGWWIVRNPKYHDPCWMPDKYLQIDAGVNVSALPIFTTPFTPTPTP